MGCWSGSAQYTQTIKETLPVGIYTIVVAVYNSKGGTNAIANNLIGFIENGGTKHLASTTQYPVNTWKYEFITFTLDSETSGYVTIGYKSANTGSGNMPHLFISGLELYEGIVDAEAYEAAKALKRKAGEWGVAKAAAETALTDITTECDERTALVAEVAKAEPTDVDGYDVAIAALNDGVTALKAAKAAFEVLDAAKAAEYTVLAYASDAAKAALDEAKKATATSKEAAEAATAAITTALRAYYESHALAEGVDGAVDMTSKIANANNPTNNNDWTWTGNKNNPASNEPWTDADGISTHSYFDGGNWGANAWTTTMEQTVSVPAGKYLLTAKGRAAENTTLTLAVGEASVELPHVGSTGNVFNRGWGDASVEFESDGSDITIVVTATSSTLHEWFSISDFRLVRLELYTEMAKAEDYAALNEAVEAAEAKTLGFEAGEYAPYKNVEAIKAIAEAKNIDQEAENAKVDIEALTVALGSWAANDADVDAIFDGQFATTEANATSGDINLPGWTKVTGIRLLVKDEATDPGLAYTDGKAAVFSWGGTTLTYGEQDGYTLPLNKHELYKLTFKIAAWRDGTWPNLVRVTLDGVAQEKAISVPGKVNNAEGNPFLSMTFYVTPTADNSVLSVYANQHFVLADLSLVPAVAEEITLDDAVAYEAVETYANVTLNRTIKAGFNTVVLPFDLTAAQVADVFGAEAKVYTFEEVADGENSTINFNTKEGNTIEANVPVLVGGAAAATEKVIEGVLTSAAGVQNVKGTNFDFVGVYAPAVVAEGDYFVGNGALYKSTGETAINAFRAYIKANGTGEVKLFIDGVETGVSAISGVAVENGAVYNLAGQRVQKAQKGIFIIGGKKVIVK